MKRNILVAVLSMFALAVPQFASPGQDGDYGGNRYRGEHTAPAQYQYQGGRSDGWNRGYHDRNRDNRSYRDADRRDDYGRGGYGYGRYDDRDRHVGRSVAIIGGSAAGGALIGGAVGQGRGAAVGAVVGGVAGLIGDQIARHHERR